MRQERAKMETKTGKRIVSKERYAANAGKKAALSSFGVGVILTGTLLTLLTCRVLWLTGISTTNVWLYGATALLLGGISAYLFYAGTRAVRDANQIDMGIPLTRANTADLPAPDSLVRASSEPLQAQETVLLRAAAEGTERHEEQLVRASMGQE